MSRFASSGQCYETFYNEYRPVLQIPVFTGMIFTHCFFIY